MLKPIVAHAGDTVEVSAHSTEHSFITPRQEPETLAGDLSHRGRVRIFLLAAMVVPVAAQQCKSVVGSFETDGQSANTCPDPLCTAGHVWGGIQGEYRFTMNKIIPSGEPEVSTIFFFTGHSIVTLKSGDELFGTDTGTIDLPPGQSGFASLITFTGGSGGNWTNPTAWGVRSGSRYYERRLHRNGAHSAVSEAGPLPGINHLCAGALLIAVVCEWDSPGARKRDPCCPDLTAQMS